jgi:septal ring factor EnvC (AmiA/AmiB activator)
VARAPHRLIAVLVATLACCVPASGAAPGERPTAEQKRCAAAERRVDRHRESLAQLDARLERQRQAREACASPRACDRVDREIKSEETRRRRIERQLAQFESESEAICADARRVRGLSGS